MVDFGKRNFRVGLVGRAAIALTRQIDGYCLLFQRRGDIHNWKSILQKCQITS